jgi:molecular chaperone DnaJ
MAAVFKNYYQILGVEQSADADAIKAAFRQLARKFHPDLNNGNQQFEEKFKEINEAYEILGNPEKRAMHDTMLKAMQGLGMRKSAHKAGPHAKTKGQPQAQAPSQSKTASAQSAYQNEKDAAAKAKAEQVKASESASSSSQVDEAKGKSKSSEGNVGGGLFESFLKKNFSDGGNKNTDKNADKNPEEEGIFRKKKAENRGAAQEPPRRGEDVVVKTSISTMEATEGVVKTVNVQHNEICRRCAGTGKLNGSTCQACNGEKILVRLKKIDVRIPAGVKNGSRVRVAKEGGRGSGGLENGDLFLQIEIVYDSSLRIEGMDVHGEAALSFTDAVLGGEIEVPTLNGLVKVTIPPGTQTGRVFRLKERGVQSGQSKGDHYVTIVVITPENLTTREKELYTELARLRPEKPSLKKPR